MTIKRCGSGWLIDVRVPTEDGRSCRLRRKVFGSRRKAEQWAWDIVNAARVGRLILPAAEADEAERPRQLAFETFAWEWFETYAKPNNKPSEVVGKESTLRVHLIPFFGNLDMRAFTALDVERYKAEKVKVVSPKTVNNHISVLKKMFNSALDWDLLDRNPIARVKKLRETDYEWHFLPREESERFLAALDARWLPLFATLLWTGLRLGEALALRHEDILWAQEKIVVRRSVYQGQFVAPKSGKSREVPMNSRLQAVLEAVPKGQGDLVFATAEGTLLDPANVKRPFFAALKRAGLPRLRIHDLRHSFASQLATAGVPIKVVQELLGHQSMAMTLRYAHLLPETRRDAVEVLVEPGPEAVQAPATEPPVTGSTTRASASEADVWQFLGRKWTVPDLEGRERPLSCGQKINEIN